jgi:hypothetical protein
MLSTPSPRNAAFVHVIRRIAVMKSTRHSLVRAPYELALMTILFA